MAVTCKRARNMDDTEIKKGLPSIGEELRNVRTSLGLSRRAVAERSGVSARQIQHIEDGTRGGTLGALSRVSCALGVSLGTVIGAVEAGMGVAELLSAFDSGQLAQFGLSKTKLALAGFSHAAKNKTGDGLTYDENEKGVRADITPGAFGVMVKAGAGGAGRGRSKGGGMLRTAPAPSYTSAQVETIRQSICPGATDEELALFLQVCASSGLSPFTRDVYAIRTGGRLSFIISIDGYRKIAHNSNELHSISAPDFEMSESGGLISATVTVLRYDDRGALATYKGRTFWEEYGSARGPWGKMPRQMLGKTAEAQALRRAFALELSGTYTADEMPEEKSPSRPSEIKVSSRDAALENDRFNRLNSLWQNARGRGWTPEHMRVIKGEILGDESLTVKDFTDEQFDLITARIRKDPPGGV